MRYYYPDGNKDLSRTTHLGIGAHQDDLEIMAMDGISQCYKHPTKWFSGITCTSGSGSARSGKFEKVTDEKMVELRALEQERAAKLGKYGSMVQLGFSSAQVKNEKSLVEPLKDLIARCVPRVIYTHNLADKHPTHRAVAIQVIEALRQLDYPLEGFYGCEVWRGLDWLGDDQKVAFDLTKGYKLTKKLLKVYKSQIEGGKSYDQATLGRMLANATYFESHATDKAEYLWFAMDYKPLLDDPQLGIKEFLGSKTKQFCDDLLLVL